MNTSRKALMSAAHNEGRERNWLSRPMFVCSVLVLTVCVVYWPVTGYDFISYDDPSYFSLNSHVQAGLSPASVVWAFHTNHMGYWQPLTWLSFMLDVSLFGKGATGPHATNVLLHAANSVLLFLLLRRLTGAHWKSAFVAGLFALHPLRVESVAWVTERKDVLSTFFGLLSLIFYVRYAQQCGARSKEQGVSFSLILPLYFLSLLLFALGLMSKPMLVTLPFVMLLLDWWPLQRGSRVKVQGSRFEAGDAPHVTHDSRPSTEPRKLSGLDLRLLWRLVLEKVPFFLAGAVFSVVTFKAQSTVGAVIPLADESVVERIENAFLSYARYLGKTVWPVNLALPYPLSGGWPLGAVLLSVMLVIGLCVLAVWVGQSRSYIFVGWFWFWGTIFPVIGLVQSGQQSMADRFTYLPQIGLFLAAVWGGGEILLRRLRFLTRFVSGSVACVVLAACAARSANQLSYWQNSETIFRHTLAVTENNPLAHCALANYFREQGRIEEAVRHYDETLRLDPANADALNNLGAVRLDQLRYEEAAELCRKALGVSPKYRAAMVNLGNALTGLKQFPEAIGYFNTVLERDPEDAMARVNLGTALIKMGRTEEGINQFREALRRVPGCGEAHVELAKAFAAQGQLTESIAEYQKALADYQKIPEAVKPNATLHYNLGTLLGMAGHGDEAVAHYREALRLKPDYAEAHNNLGIALTLKGELSEAVQHFEVALRLQPENAEAHNNLAYALIQLGRREEAIAQLREALRLRPDYPQALSQLHQLEPGTSP